MSRHIDESINGNRSVIPPGLMPVPCNVVLPRRQASSSNATFGVSGG